jgi:hypothetical protein
MRPLLNLDLNEVKGRRPGFLTLEGIQGEN